MTISFGLWLLLSGSQPEKSPESSHQPSSLSRQQQQQVLSLSRGARLESNPFMARYWEVHEAEIDSAAPNLPIPTTFAVSGSKGRKVLIRFGSLDLAVPTQFEIEDATLQLTLVPEAEGESTTATATTKKTQIGLKSVSLLKKPWVHPGVGSIMGPSNSMLPKPPVVDPLVKPFSPGVTWNSAGGDYASWQSSGAAGNADQTAIPLKSEVVNGVLKIQNLGEVANNWLKHEGENFGLLLEFEQETAFWSSSSPETRPQLNLTLKPSTRKLPDAHLVSEAGALDIKSSHAVEHIDLFRGVAPVKESLPLKVAKPSRSKDSRANVLKFVVRHQDPEVTDAVIFYDPDGQELSVHPLATRVWNRNTVDSSYYSFAPRGPGKYVNAIGDSSDREIRSKIIPKPNFGSNLTDTQLLKGLIPPVRPNKSPVFKQLGRPIAGDLTFYEASWIAFGQVKYPKVTLLKLTNLDSVPLSGISTSAKLSGNVFNIGKSDRNGLIILPKIENGFVGNIEIEVEISGQKEQIQVPSWHFSDQFVRGNTDSVAIELPIQASLVPVNRDTNLALRKLVKDAKSSFPAQLIALVDGNPATSFTLPAGGWVEVDLGRDRLVAEVILKGAAPKNLLITIYGTSEKPEEAQEWIDIPDLESFLRDFGQLNANEFAFRPSPLGGRYLRLLNRSTEAVSIQDWVVYAGRRE